MESGSRMPWSGWRSTATSRSTPMRAPSISACSTSGAHAAPLAAPSSAMTCAVMRIRVSAAAMSIDRLRMAVSQEVPLYRGVPPYRGAPPFPHRRHRRGFLRHSRRRPFSGRAAGTEPAPGSPSVSPAVSTG